MIAALSGRPNEALERLLLGQLQVLEAAATEAHLVCTGESIPAEALERSGECLARAREYTDRLHHQLANCLSTPIDREDLLRISRSLECGSHGLYEFVRETQLYGPASLDRQVTISQGLVSMVDCLRAAVAVMATAGRAPAEEVRRTRLAALALERCYQQQLAALFNQETATESLRALALLSRLDSVRFHLLQAADAVADGAMKRGLRDCGR